MHRLEKQGFLFSSGISKELEDDIVILILFIAMPVNRPDQA